MYKILKSIFLLFVKLLILVVVAFMAFMQLPELRYDLGDKTPEIITDKDSLENHQFKQPAFVAIHGRADFGNAFTYKRYGLTFTYFTVKPYGLKIVARTHDRVTDEWTKLDRFLGKMRPFAEQPFSYRIKEIFQEQHDISIPPNAYFLALDDVPAVSGWQVGAIVFSIILWCVLFYLFFFYRGNMFRSTRSRKLQQDRDKT